NLRRETFIAHAEHIRTKLISEITKNISDVEVNQGRKHVPHILNVSLPGRDTDYLIALLDEAGFAVSTKSACETDVEGSRAVFALTNDLARAASTLRISWGPITKESELTAFVAALTKAVAFIDRGPA
ncbi:MAG: hypothetical protein WAV21_03070, partial [Minisyncoccia bacterium]